MYKCLEPNLPFTVQGNSYIHLWLDLQLIVQLEAREQHVPENVSDQLRQPTRPACSPSRSSFSLLSTMHVSPHLESRFPLSPAYPLCPVSPALPWHFPKFLPVTPTPLWILHRALTGCPPGSSNLFTVPSPAPRLSQGLTCRVYLNGACLAASPPHVRSPYASCFSLLLSQGHSAVPVPHP